MTKGKKLSAEFYKDKDVVKLSKQLLGKVLCSFIDKQYTSGIITETEAYEGIIDKASHAYNNRRTARTEIMFGEGGKSYVYLCYGIHHLFNVVTNEEDHPHAVLVRAIEPLDGIDIILQRRKKASPSKDLTVGPGKVSEALGIKTKHTGLELTGDVIWIEDRGIKVNEKDITAGPRVGVDYAGDHALWPYRFIYNRQGS
jgi:DNA-3-methyladenine glycosylase